MSTIRQKTDWEDYYRRPYRTAGLTRSITGAHIISAMHRFGPRRPVIVELGGGNSCFYAQVREKIDPAVYHIVDNNRLGLDRFRERYGTPGNVFLHHQDVFSLQIPVQADLTFSVGLIEHFNPEDLWKAVEAHFQILKPGGIALMAFPTPTWLYRLTRRLSEMAGLWIFHDERPLSFEEVEAAASNCGNVLEKRIVWPIFLTQYHAIWKKHESVELFSLHRSNHRSWEGIIND